MSGDSRVHAARDPHGDGHVSASRSGHRVRPAWRPRWAPHSVGHSPRRPHPLSLPVGAPPLPTGCGLHALASALHRLWSSATSNQQALPPSAYAGPRRAGPRRVVYRCWYIDYALFGACAFLGQIISPGLVPYISGNLSAPASSRRQQNWGEDHGGAHRGERKSARKI